MKFLANENFPLLAVTALRDAGHDVLWARTRRGLSRVRPSGQWRHYSMFLSSIFLSKPCCIDNGKRRRVVY